MATPKSPFLIYENFISPKICEEIIYSLNFFEPDKNKDGKPIPMSRFHEDSGLIIFERLQQIIPNIQQHYQIEYAGTEPIEFEFLARGTTGEPHCENSNFLKKSSKWLKTRNRDISGIVFLVDYNENPPFDNEYEVYGGKLEFPQHKFGFNPVRGTLILFPSGPHFINTNAPVIFGDLYQARIQIAAQTPLLYNPQKFPGDYRTWFKGMY